MSRVSVRRARNHHRPSLSPSRGTDSPPRTDVHRVTRGGTLPHSSGGKGSLRTVRATSTSRRWPEAGPRSRVRHAFPPSRRRPCGPVTSAARVRQPRLPGEGRRTGGSGAGSGRARVAAPAANGTLPSRAAAGRASMPVDPGPARAAGGSERASERPTTPHPRGRLPAWRQDPTPLAETAALLGPFESERGPARSDRSGAVSENSLLTPRTPNTL